MGKNAPTTDDVQGPQKYDSVEDALAQTAQYFGFPTGEDIPIKVDGQVEIFTVPFPGTLNDQQQEAMNQLQFEIDQCDRYPDLVIPDHKLVHKEIVGARTVTEGEKVTEETDVVVENETFVPGRTIPGDSMLPYRTTGPDGTVTLMEPSYNARVAIALWGKERYERFKANGGQSRLVALLQTKMQREFDARKKADSKSGSGVDALDQVSEADSDGST